MCVPVLILDSLLSAFTHCTDLSVKNATREMLLARERRRRSLISMEGTDRRIQARKDKEAADHFEERTAGATMIQKHYRAMIGRRWAATVRESRADIMRRRREMQEAERRQNIFKEKLRRELASQRLLAEYRCPRAEKGLPCPRGLK